MSDPAKFLQQVLMEAVRRDERLAALRWRSCVWAWAMVIALFLAVVLACGAWSAGFEETLGGRVCGGLIGWAVLCFLAAWEQKHRASRSAEAEGGALCRALFTLERLDAVHLVRDHLVTVGAHQIDRILQLSPDDRWVAAGRPVVEE